MDEFAFHRALTAVWEFVATLNRYVDTEQPWALAKAPEKAGRLQTVFYTLAESLRSSASYWRRSCPTRPARSARRSVRAASRSSPTRNGGDSPPARRCRSSPASFRAWTTRKPADGGVRESAPAAAGSTIKIDDFGKVELRVAEVVAAEPVPKSKKLLKLTVSLGAEQRTLVAGIAEHYAPADLVGKKVVRRRQLEPAKLMGVESNGMVLPRRPTGSWRCSRSTATCRPARRSDDGRTSTGRDRAGGRARRVGRPRRCARS